MSSDLACRIQSCVKGQDMFVGFDPLAKALYDSLGESVYNLAKKVHGLPFRLGLRGCYFTIKWGNCAHVSNGCSFRPAQGFLLYRFVDCTRYSILLMFAHEIRVDQLSS
jgi:hypothetical protein